MSDTRRALTPEEWFRSHNPFDVYYGRTDISDDELKMIRALEGRVSPPKGSWLIFETTP